MNRLVQTIIGTIIGLLVIIGGYKLFGWTGFILLVVATIVVISSIWYVYSGLILIDETEYGVIFNKQNNSFAYFIDSKKPEASARRHKLINRLIHQFDPYHHFIDPIEERLDSKIPRLSQSTSGEISDIRTKEGIPVTIRWKVSFKVDVFKIKQGIEFNMARSLPKSVQGMMTNRMIQVIRHLMEQKSIEELYGYNAIKTLEEEVRVRVSERAKNIGVLEIDNNDVVLGPIIMPEEVEKAICTELERRIHTNITTHSLQELKKVVCEFDKEVMERLAMLERLRILENSDSPVYMMNPGMSRDQQAFTMPRVP